MNHRLPTLARHFPSLVLALTSVLGLVCCNKPRAREATAERGTVTRVSAPSTGSGLQICDPKGASCSRAATGSSVPAGSVLRSGAQSSAQIALADGTELALDHDTELSLASQSAGHARLSRGAIVLEIPSKTAARARFDLSAAFVELGAGKVLTGLIKRIAPDAATVSAGTPAEIEAMLKSL